MKELLKVYVVYFNKNIFMSRQVSQLIDEEGQRRKDEARIEMEERANENTHYNARLAAFEQTMEKIMIECEKVYEEKQMDEVKRHEASLLGGMRDIMDAQMIEKA